MDDCGLRQMKKEVVRLCHFCTVGYLRKTRLFKGNYKRFSPVCTNDFTSKYDKFM